MLGFVPQPNLRDQRSEYFVDGGSSDIELLGDFTGPEVLGFHGQHLLVVHATFTAKLHAFGLCFDTPLVGLRWRSA